MRPTLFPKLRYFKERLSEMGGELFSDSEYSERQGGRSWEDYYRRRWQYDKVARSTHVRIQPAAGAPSAHPGQAA